MSTDSDRRTPHASRIPFDAMVEVGGALGPSFEAQAVNLSEEGMSLRTTYLPEVGQPITCRFDAGQGMTVIAAGEVLWKEDMGDGGEFGIRFTNLDQISMTSLQRILGVAHEEAAADPLGRKVRLHIDGLASPMRARVKRADGTCVTAYSELGFLQVGKQLDLEDAMTGGRRPALIDRVEVEIERESHVPQLVVTLRYDDEEAHAMDVAHEDPIIPPLEDEMSNHDGTTDGHVMDEMHASTGATGEAALPSEAEAKAAIDDEESKKLKSAFARGALKARDNATAAFMQWSKKAKTTFAMMAARASKKSEGSSAEPAPRRTTAPPPGGALHASGRKVVRGEIEESKEFDPVKPRFVLTKKKMVIATAVSGAMIIGLVAMRKPAPAPIAASTETTAAMTPAAAATAPSPNAMPNAGPATPANDPLVSAAMDPNGTGEIGPNGKPQPFGNGPVGTHGNTLKIKMDGAIGRIQGASQPTGFTVVLPGRKSLESAGPLAAKDPRIAAIKVANEASGAELTVTFKDGVPNYQVRAHGDTLEMILARGGGATADKGSDAKPAHKKHKKH